MLQVPPSTQTKVQIQTKPVTKPHVSQAKTKQTINTPKQAPRKVTPSGTEYIRIKLKPDHMYDTEDTEEDDIPPKPASLSLNNGTVSDGPSAITTAPKPHVPPSSRTPSPSVSRKSSFTSLFRSRESATSSPESPAPRGKPKATASTSVFGSIFKPKKSCIKRQTSPEDTPKTPRASKAATAPRPPNLEFTFGGTKPKLKYYETPLEGESIRIPLHSPGTEPEPLQLMSPDTPPRPPDKEVIASPPPVVASNPRHSSTSSDNVIFSTNLGSFVSFFVIYLVIVVAVFLMVPQKFPFNIFF